MKLSGKLFVSYLVVVILSLVTLAAATAFIAPATFSDYVSHSMHGQGMGRMMRNMGMGNMGMGAEPMEAFISGIQTEMEVGFRASLNRALAVTGLVAVVIAVGVSWLISRRITRPIQETVTASRHIAAGDYEKRLPVSSQDELGTLAESFNHMAEALANTEATRQQLIADVSHELKTPLASIKGYMEGLQDGVIPATSETFQLIHREAGRLQMLVHDLQELSRAEAAQLDLHLSACDAGELVESAVAWLRPQFEDKGVALVADLPGPAVQVRADFDRARQVLLNLLGNALQYTPPGGEVKVELSQGDEGVCFRVQDTGVGLAAEDLERVFQRFYRVDRSRSRRSGGSGVGLTIARHIVEMHGGRIWAESDGPGAGSTFQFTLPPA